MGVMSGTLDLVQRAYPGSRSATASFNSSRGSPQPLEELSFSMQFQRTPLRVTLDHDRLVLTVHREGMSGAIRVGIGDDVRELCPGDTETFELSAAGRSGSARAQT